MGTFMQITRLATVALFVSLSPVMAHGQTVEALSQDIDTHGVDPANFVYEALDAHPLVIFDDGLHNLAEPWHFYARIIPTEAFASRARHVCLETLNVNDQPDIDAYLSTYPEDRSLLYPALQNANIHGWRYGSYVDLLSAIHAFNADRTPETRIEVHAVSTPGYWREVATPADYENYIGIAQAGRDAFMYAAIRRILDGMSGEERGVFLTNTRHAYTGLRNADGELFWNTATYFAEREPGQSYSIRINAPFLVIERERSGDAGPTSGEGLEQVQYRWGRAADGNWDRAFRARGDQPVALELDGTAFAATPYVGNSMLHAAPGQTMAAVYDGLIHLGPIDRMHQARVEHALYSPAYRAEVERRYRAAYTPDELAQFLENNEAGDLTEVTGYLAEPAAERLSPQAEALPPLDDR